MITRYFVLCMFLFPYNAHASWGSFFGKFTGSLLGTHYNKSHSRHHEIHIVAPHDYRFLENKIDVLEYKNKILSQENCKLEKDTLIVQQENIRLTNQLKNEHDTIHQLQKKLTALQQENDALKKKKIVSIEQTTPTFTLYI